MYPLRPSSGFVGWLDLVTASVSQVDVLGDQLHQPLHTLLRQHQLDIVLGACLHVPASLHVGTLAICSRGRYSVVGRLDVYSLASVWGLSAVPFSGISHSTLRDG